MYAPPPPLAPNPDRLKPKTLLLVLGGLAIVLAAIAAIVVFTMGNSTSSSSSQSPTSRSTADVEASCRAKAEDYVQGAATVDYRDLPGFQRRLKNGVSPELAKRYDGIADQMAQMIRPLQMVSTAKIISTQTELRGGSCIAIVTTSVHSISVQNPQGADRTAVYQATIDNASGLITDISDPTMASGLGSAPTTAAAPTS